MTKLDIARSVSIVDVVELVQEVRVRGNYAHGIAHDSLVLNLVKNMWYWNSEGVGGDVIKWVMLYVPFNNKYEYDPSGTTPSKFIDAVNFLVKMAGGVVQEPRHIEIKQAKPIDMDLVEKYHQCLLGSEEGLRLWYARGVSDAEIERFKLGYKTNHWGRGESLVIPYLHNGSCAGIRHRIVNPLDGNRYLPEEAGQGVHVFNEDVLDGDLDQVIVLEGEIKAIVASRYGVKCVATPGMVIMPCVERLAKFKSVIIVPDPPVAALGKIGWINTLKGMTNVKIARVTGKVDDIILQHGYEGWRYIHKSIQGAR